MRLILFSGMGGDGRLMRPIRTAGADVTTPDHLEPEAEETLAGYAVRVAETLKIGATDVIGGASFGGMLAAEIASRRRVAGLILLGSSIQPRRLPWSYIWMERIGRFVPDAALRVRSWGPLVRWRFAPISLEAERILIAMAESCPASQIRGFGRMALDWPGVERVECPVLSIHGDDDRIIPISAAAPGHVLKGAGHAFTLTHARETTALIDAFLQTQDYR